MNPFKQMTHSTPVLPFPQIKPNDLHESGPQPRATSFSSVTPLRNGSLRDFSCPAALQESWSSHPRWRGVTRPYTADKVLRLRGTLKIEHTIADRMSRKLWVLLHHEPYVNALGALTGNQAVQMAQAGLKAIYLSGWQVAADANLSNA